MSIPRYYQSRAIEFVLLAWEESHRVLLVSPTGSGKNFMAANIIKRLLPSRCLFLGDQSELVFQPADAISRFAGIVPAIEKAERHAPLNSKVVVASVQSISRAKTLERYPPDFFSYIINDEAHRHVESKNRVFEYFAQAKVCGLSATPFRATMKDLSKWYDDTAFSLPILDLMAQGFAPPWNIVTPDFEIDLAGVEIKKGPEGKDYDAESLSTTIEPCYEQIAELIKPYVKGHHGIAFLPLIKSSEAFSAIARRAGITAIHIDGKSPGRDEILTAFRMGRYELLCNANLAETGVDIPIADVFLNLRLTRSAVKYQQSVGRVLRVLPGIIDHLPDENQAEERKAAIAASAKPFATIINLLLQHDELGVIGPESLIAQTQEEALGIAEAIKKQRTPLQLEEIARRVQEDKESKLVKKLEEVAIRKGGKIEPAAFAILIENKPLQNFTPSMKWHFEDPTEKQLLALEKFGLSREGIDTKGYAGKLMENLIWRAEHCLARLHSLKKLRELHIPFDPKSLSETQAKQLLARAKISRLVNAA